MIHKTIVFEGNVKEVSEFIKQVVGDHQTINLKEYLQSDVYGVYKEGDEKFRYYYECFGDGKYTVFTASL